MSLIPKLAKRVLTPSLFPPEIIQILKHGNNIYKYLDDIYKYDKNIIIATCKIDDKKKFDAKYMFKYMIKYILTTDKEFIFKLVNINHSLLELLTNKK